MSIAICSSSLYATIFNEFTKLQKEKKSTKRVHFLNRNESNPASTKWKIENCANIILKISLICLIVIIFIILLNTFTSYRNVCCLDLLESILSEENHTIHVIKQICFTFICLYIFGYSHGNLKLAMKNASEIIFYLFGCEKESQKFKADNHELLTENNNDAEVYRPTTSNANLNRKKSCCSCQLLSYYVLFFDKKTLIVKKIEALVLAIFFIITIFKLLFMEKLQLIYLWSISFLVMNFFIVAAVLLLNYFPYQVLIDVNSKDNKSYSKSLLFETREEDPLITQQKVVTTTQLYSHSETTKIEKQVGEELDHADDANSIEDAFQAHRQTLKNIALSNKGLSFGNNQPSMMTAYKVSFRLNIL